jgi:hypothetical protein
MSYKTIYVIIFFCMYDKQIWDMSVWAVEILDHFTLAHIRFQEFLRNLKAHVCKPMWMQPKLLAAQRQGVGAKFSPT